MSTKVFWHLSLNKNIVLLPSCACPLPVSAYQGSAWKIAVCTAIEGLSIKKPLINGTIWMRGVLLKKSPPFPHTHVSHQTPWRQQKRGQTMWAHLPSTTAKERLRPLTHIFHTQKIWKLTKKVASHLKKVSTTSVESPVHLFKCPWFLHFTHTCTLTNTPHFPRKRGGIDGRQLSPLLPHNWRDGGGSRKQAIRPDLGGYDP